MTPNERLTPAMLAALRDALPADVNDHRAIATTERTGVTVAALVRRDLLRHCGATTYCLTDRGRAVAMAAEAAA